MKARDIMTTELFTLRTDHKLNLADDIMSWKRIRHIPIVNHKNHLVGLLTHRDLLKASQSSLARPTKEQQREFFRKISVEDIMQKNVVTTTPDADLRDVASIMIDEKMGCLPVVEGKDLVGIITEADFLTLAWEAMGQKSQRENFVAGQKYTKHKST